MLIRLHGGSASTARKRLFKKEHGSRYVALPSGRLVSHKTQVPYLGIILSYLDYESLTLTHRLKASKKALSDVAHAVRNYRVLSEHRRRSIWAITAWASALYAIHVVGLSSKGLGKLESHMAYQLRFVLWSYSRDTHETNQELLRRKGLKSAQQQLQGRLSQFLKRQVEADPTLTPFYLPRARKLADTLQQLKPQEHHTDPRSREVTCSECGAVFSGTGPLRRHMQKQHATSRTMQKGPKFDPSVHTIKGTASCTACGAHFSSFFSLRKHVETTTCPRSDLLFRKSEELPIEIQHQQEAQARLRAAVLTDLDAAARDPAHHSLFMESCVSLRSDDLCPEGNQTALKPSTS